MVLGSTVAQNIDLAGMYGDDKGSTAPSTGLAHLYEGDPTSGGSEITGTGYAPLSLANTTAVMGTPSGGLLGPITLNFGTAGADDWGTPDHWAFTDLSGNLLDTQEISDPTVINDGDPVVLTVTLGAQ